MLFQKTKTNTALELILSIQSDAVYGTIVGYNDLPTVLYSTKKLFSIRDKADNVTLISEMKKALTAVLDTITSDGVRAVVEIHPHARIQHSTVTFSAPWYHAQVKDIVLKKEKPFVLKRKAFDALVEKYTKDTQTNSPQRTMLEHDVTHVMINGYELQDPFNKKTNEISLSFYASFIETTTLHTVRECIATTLHHVPVTYRTASLIAFTTIRNMFWNIDRFTVFDIGSIITEINVVDSGAITHIATIPSGSQTLLAEVEKTCRADTRTTASIIAMLARGEVHPNCAQTIQTAVASIQKKWVTAVQAELVDSAGISLPQKVFIIAQQAMAPMFKQVCTAPKTAQNLFGTNQELQVAIITPDHFRKYITTTENTTLETSTAMTIVFLQATK